MKKKTIKIRRTDELELGIKVVRQCFKCGGWPTDRMSDGDIMYILAVRTAEWLCESSEEVLAQHGFRRVDQAEAAEPVTVH